MSDHQWPVITAYPPSWGEYDAWRYQSAFSRLAAHRVTRSWATKFFDLYRRWSLRRCPDHEITVHVALPTAVMEEIEAINHLLRTELAEDGPGSGLFFVLEEDELRLRMQVFCGYGWGSMFEDFIVDRTPRNIFVLPPRSVSPGMRPTIKNLRRALREALLFVEKCRASNAEFQEALDREGP